MRLKMILPQVEASALLPPEVCPRRDCNGTHLRLHQRVSKPLKDTVYSEVPAFRYVCLRCGHTFRVYPQGVSKAHTSARVEGLGVMFYLLGLSYGATSLVLEALGVYMCKSRVYDAVQEAAKKVPGLKRRSIFGELRRPALGGDLTSVRCNGKWLTLGLAVDDTEGTVLSLDILPGEDAETLKMWLKPLFKATGAKFLVSADADGFKQVANEEGMKHQVCESHVGRNTEALIKELKEKAQDDGDGSLGAIGLSPEEAVADLERLGELLRRRAPDPQRSLYQAEYSQPPCGLTPKVGGLDS